MNVIRTKARMGLNALVGLMPRDKWLHTLVGFALFWPGYTLPVLAGLHPALGHLAGLVLVYAVAVLYEAWQETQPDRSPDCLDAMVTIAGGCVACLTLLLATAAHAVLGG